MRNKSAIYENIRLSLYTENIDPRHRCLVHFFNIINNIKENPNKIKIKYNCKIGTSKMRIKFYPS